MNEKRAYIYSFSTESSVMRPYLLALLRAKQNDKCNLCQCDLRESGYQIDHKRYELDMTLEDLQLLCGKCHALKTGIASHNGVLARLVD